MTKYQALADALRSAIQGGVYQPNDALPTEQALCGQYQVSRETVRQALGLLEKERLITRRQGSGTYVRDNSRLVRQELRTIAVVTTYISDYIFPAVLREMESVLSENRATPMLFATQNEVANERNILGTLLKLDKLDGVLVEGTKTGLPNPNLSLYRALIARGVPLVFFHGNYAELSDIPCVLDDNYNGGQMLVEHLIRNGRRRIAGIFKSDDIQGHQRYSGYADALNSHNLPLKDEHVLWYSTEHKDHLFRRNAPQEPVLRALEGCDAVVCYNDEVASSLVSQLPRIGVDIPHQLSVVSFDNSPFSEMSTPRITSLSHMSLNVGRLAAELLFRILRNEPHNVLELAPWTLVRRESG